MNKVYLSGIIVESPLYTAQEGRVPHLAFPLQVSHRSKAGVKHEAYRVSAWNGTAQWGAGNLKKGQRIALQGYLVQRGAAIGNIPLVAVEVAVDEFFVMDDLPRAEITQPDAPRMENLLPPTALAHARLDRMTAPRAEAKAGDNPEDGEEKDERGRGAQQSA
ncbi:MAG: single-stranded DNA-binding protein [Clostridiales bacterium]|nr:single-stranded DNA-binding protein [Clostridiales bacterium]